MQSKGLPSRRDGAVCMMLLAAFGVSCGAPEEQAVPTPPPSRVGVGEPQAIDGGPFQVEPLSGTQSMKPDPPATAGTLSELEGTRWRAEEYIFVFHGGGHVIVKGGNFAEFAPNGVPARVSIEEGIVELRTAGRLSWGTWDGRSLWIDGTEAELVSDVRESSGEAGSTQ